MSRKNSKKPKAKLKPKTKPRFRITKAKRKIIKEVSYVVYVLGIGLYILFSSLSERTSASANPAPTTSTTASAAESYRYSPNGRILYKSDIGDYEYNDPRHPHAPTKAGDTTYTYDANGNRISETRNNETTKYSYNAFNRLVSITNKNGTTKYVYSHNRRVKKILPSGESFTYTNNDLAEIEDSSGSYVTYLFLEQQRIATIFNNQTRYHINDHLNSPVITTNQFGVVTQKRDYIPFGQERVNIMNDPYMSDIPLHSFTDKEHDPESGLIYFKARYYDPRIGVFTQQDPVIVRADTNNPAFQYALLNPQLLNPYAYVGNNPIVNVDENGESTKKAWALNPVGTLLQTRAWAGFSRIYFERVKGYQISADLLERSLTLNPSALTVTGSNEYAYIAEAIQKSPEYRQLVQELITDAEKNNETGFRKFLTNKEGGGQDNTDVPLVFNAGDLKTALHGTEATHIKASKQFDGSWEVSTAILDTYDFNLKTYKEDTMLNAGNNAALVSQKAQAISPYQVNVTFNHRVMLNPRKPP